MSCQPAAVRLSKLTQALSKVLDKKPQGSGNLSKQQRVTQAFKAQRQEDHSELWYLFRALGGQAASSGHQEVKVAELARNLQLLRTKAGNQRQEERQEAAANEAALASRLEKAHIHKLMMQSKPLRGMKRLELANKMALSATRSARRTHERRRRVSSMQNLLQVEG
jgi:hypothetical protein